MFLTRDQPSLSDWIHGPGSRRLSPVTADVIAGGIFDPQREPECAAALLAGMSEQHPGQLREQIFLAMCPCEHARESAGTGRASCGADRGEHSRLRRERSHPFRRMA